MQMAELHVGGLQSDDGGGAKAGDKEKTRTSHLKHSH